MTFSELKNYISWAIHRGVQLVHQPVISGAPTINGVTRTVPTYDLRQVKYFDEITKDLVTPIPKSEAVTKESKLFVRRIDTPLLRNRPQELAYLCAAELRCFLSRSARSWGCFKSLCNLGFAVLFLQSLLLAQPNTFAAPVLVAPLGHSGGVRSITTTRDGRLMASWGTDGMIRIWDARNGWYLRGIQWSPRAYVELVFSPDNEWIIAGIDGTATVWSTRTGELLRELRDNVRTSYGTPLPDPVAISNDGKRVAMASVDSQSGEQLLLIWDTSDWQLRQRLSAGQGVGRSLQFAGSTHHLVSVWSETDRSTIRLWDTDNGQLLRELTASEATGADLSSNERYLAIGSWNDSVTALDFQTGQTFLSLAGPNSDSHTSANYSVTISPQNELLAATDGRWTSVWHLPDGNIVRQSDEWARMVVFSSTGDLITGDDSGEILVRSAKSGDTNQAYVKAGDKLQKIALDRASLLLAGISPLSKEVRLWDLKRGREREPLKTDDFLTGIQFSPDGTYLATADDSHFIRLWDYNTQRILRTFKSENIPYNLTFTPDSRLLMLAGRFALKTKIWDLSSLTLLKEFTHSANAGTMSIAVSADGKFMAEADDHNVVLRSVSNWSVVRTLTTDYGGIYSLDFVTFHPSGTLLAAAAFNRVSVWDLSSWSVKELKGQGTSWVTSLLFSDNGQWLVSGHQNGTLSFWNVKDGLAQPDVLNVHEGWVSSLAFGPDDRWLVSGGSDGTVSLVDMRTKKALGTLISLHDPSDSLIITPEGLFDGTPSAWSKVLWRFNNSTIDVSPVEIAFRDYYEPRLLPRLLAGEELPRVRPLGDLNRVQPGVKIASVKQGSQPDLAQVTVEVSPAEGQFRREGKLITMKTDVYDLRVFRQEQLVGQEPYLSPEAEASLKNGVVLTPEELNEWKTSRKVKRVKGRVELDAKTGKLTRTFTMRLPHAEAGKEVEFTAYAFNEDRVKSQTDKVKYTVPADAGPVKRRAYVVAMGVNAYEKPGWDLRFAASDAVTLQQALVKRLPNQYEVIPVTLISDCKTPGCPKEGNREIGKDDAKKVSLHAVLELLAGHPLSEELKKSLPPGAEQIKQKAGPDDLVVLSVSSHGYTSKDGMFYMIPSDSGQTEGLGLTSEQLRSLRQKWISSDELSAWLRDVDAGEMVMVVDTCHSAATVEEPGFKPGPMGSRGLGQLAYDKGMRILAASQANDVALESKDLKQGLLTYALVHDGLEAKQAVKAGTKEITLDSWLAYGSERVPKLYEEVLQGKVQTFADASRDVKVDEELSGGPSSLKKPNAFQQPSLFNFQKHDSQVFLQK